MGVKTLWSVLDCCGESVSPDELRGRTLAVDLAGWVVQNSQCRAMGGAVARPHLRNVFFRTSALMAMGVRPVFVMDGAAPKLKKETMEIRKAASQQSSQTQTQSTEVKSLSRSRLKALMNECAFMLQSLGLRCMQAEGEGEALCSRLDAAGMVDAVVTEDSDAFCYGARTVLRGFSVQAKSISVERFRAERLASGLGLDRSGMVAAAVLLGCDFFPTGVSGVGKETVLQLLQGWREPGWDALKVLDFWVEEGFAEGDCDGCGDGRHCGQCRRFMSAVVGSQDGPCRCGVLRDNKKLAKAEASVRKKCLAMAGAGWWAADYRKVVDEFFSEREVLPVGELQRYATASRPAVSACLSVLTKKLTWVEEYAQAKVIPLVTLWQVRHLANGGDSPDVVRPIKILKKRTAGGIPSLSVEWEPAEPDSGLPATFESVVPTNYVEFAYPQLYSQFAASLAKPKKPKKASAASKKKKSCQRDKSGDRDEAASSQKITQFFTQRRPLSAHNRAALDKASSADVQEDKNLTAVAEEEEEVEIKAEKKSEDFFNDVTLSDDDDDDDDLAELSFLVDRILGVGKGDKAEEAPPKQKRSLKAAFATSTPGREDKVRPRMADKENERAAAAVPSVFRHKSAQEEDDDVEDSFDRMCL